jgi:hypothetical protein
LPNPVQLQALRDLLAEIPGDTPGVNRFLERWWPNLLHGAGDPDAEYVGNSVTFRVSRDEVILSPLYDQWGDAGYVYVPLADVQDLIDQYAAYIRGS